MKTQSHKSQDTVNNNVFRHYASDQQIKELLGDATDPVLLNVAKALSQSNQMIVYDAEHGVLSTLMLNLDVDAQVQLDVQVNKTENGQMVTVRAHVPSSFIKRHGPKFAETVLKEAVFFTRDRSALDEHGIEILPTGGDVDYSYDFYIDDHWCAVTSIETPSVIESNDQSALADAVALRIGLMQRFWDVCFHQHLRDADGIESDRVHISEAHFWDDFGQYLESVPNNKSSALKASEAAH